MVRKTAAIGKAASGGEKVEKKSFSPTLSHHASATPIHARRNCLIKVDLTQLVGAGI
jgi:hypothetical protein